MRTDSWGSYVDPIFERYFRDRLNEVRSQRHPFGLRYPSGQMRRWSDPTIYDGAVREAVQHAETVRDEGLRPDGELLLYLAFTELVARPLAAARRPEISNVRDAIEQDVTEITRQALAQKAAPTLASAHDIVNATAGMWSSLRSAQWDLWD
jgi:hypothetical protein